VGTKLTRSILRVERGEGATFRKRLSSREGVMKSQGSNGVPRQRDVVACVAGGSVGNSRAMDKTSEIRPTPGNDRR